MSTSDFATYRPRRPVIVAACALPSFEPSAARAGYSPDELSVEIAALAAFLQRA